MKTVQSYLELIRYPLFAIPIVATLPGALIASEGQFNWRVGAVLLIACGLYITHRETMRRPAPPSEADSAPRADR